MKLLKEVVKKGEKIYTNYILVISLGMGKSVRVPIEVKTFGKSWDDPEVRRAYAMLSMVSDLVIVENE